jgi:Family of unknown function (DUF5335)
MKTNIERNNWARYLYDFNKHNKSRPTWLQVFGAAGAQSEEQDLPFVGISLEEKGANGPSVQIMLGRDNTPQSGHLTHVIPNVLTMTAKVGEDGRDEAIEFIDKAGEASLLIFQHRAKKAAHAVNALAAAAHA